MSEVMTPLQHELAGKYRPYPEYNDSGVEWLGNIPSQWALKKLKYLCTIQTGSKDTVNAEEDGIYPFFVRSQTVERISTFTADCEAVLTAGDGVGVGKVYHYYNGKFDYHQRVYMLSDFNDVTGRFVYYYLSSNFYKVALEGNAKSTVDSLRLPQFLNFEFSVPSISIQNSIVAFLDYETARIDRLIAQQQRLIELLKEKRQAVISHAVTKGLNPDAPMKDSGVEWLGQVPEHWGVYRLKHLATQMKAGPFGSSLTKDMYVNSGYKIYGQEQVIPGDFSIGDYYISEDKYAELRQYVVKAGDILISCVGTFGKIAVFPKDAQEGIINPRLIKVSPTEGIVPEFLEFVLRSQVVFEQMALFSRGGTMDVVNIGILSEIRVTVPPVLEQKSLLNEVYRRVEKYDHLVNKADKTVVLLQERRTALISAAVTGKIDLRGWTTPADEVAA